MHTITIQELEREAKRKGCPVFVLIDRMIEKFERKKKIVKQLVKK